MPMINNLSRAAAAPLMAIIMAVGGCRRTEPPPPAEPGYAAEHEAWRLERLDRLQAADGWLSLVGLIWLKKGKNTVGSAADADIKLPGTVPGRIGVIEYDGEHAWWTTTADKAVVLVAGAERGSPRYDLETDVSGAPTEVQVDSVTFYLIDRSDRVGVRIKDSQAKTRREFRGLEAFPLDSRLRFEASYVPHAQAKIIAIESAIGGSTASATPGQLVFQLGGSRHTLDVLAEDGAASFFVVFADKTSAKSTYGGGRFLTVPAPDGWGEATTPRPVQIDFNRATNPPCVFTPFATCPLAPPSNRLKVAIAAGEKVYGKH